MYVSMYLLFKEVVSRAVDYSDDLRGTVENSESDKAVSRLLFSESCLALVAAASSASLLSRSSASLSKKSTHRSAKDCNTKTQQSLLVKLGSVY